MKNICVVTGTRAEYGLLRPLMKLIDSSVMFQLQTIVTGMHLSPEFGKTINEIKEDGFTISAEVESLVSSDTSVGITKSLGLGIIGFGDAYQQLDPDLVLVLGDRYEMFAAVSAAMIARIPIAHLHGGEATEGLIDEAIRHSVTKMSHLHFVAAEKYRKRVIQLGEQPERVFNVGGLGVDSISKIELLSRDQLEEKLNFKLRSQNLVVTFHPVTLENETSQEQIVSLLDSLMIFGSNRDLGLIFTMPNADMDNRVVFKKIHAFVDKYEHATVSTSLGQVAYLSAVNLSDGVVGNSSSGLLEVPSLVKATINIGDRQKGRLRATSVIDCEPNVSAITQALEHIFSQKFQTIVAKTVSPYGEAGASDRIYEILKKIELSSLIKKQFYDQA